jgi:hypothetical protein
VDRKTLEYKSSRAGKGAVLVSLSSSYRITERENYERVRKEMSR